MLVTEGKILAYSWKSNLQQISISAVYKVLSFFFLFFYIHTVCNSEVPYSYLSFCCGNQYFVTSALLWIVSTKRYWKLEWMCEFTAELWIVQEWRKCERNCFTCRSDERHSSTHTHRYERTQRLSTCTMPARIVARTLLFANIHAVKMTMYVYRLSISKLLRKVRLRPVLYHSCCIFQHLLLCVHQPCVITPSS